MIKLTDLRDGYVRVFIYFVIRHKIGNETPQIISSDVNQERTDDRKPVMGGNL